LAILIKEGERMTLEHGEQLTKQASDEDGFTKVLRKKRVGTQSKSPIS